MTLQAQLDLTGSLAQTRLELKRDGVPCGWVDCQYRTVDMATIAKTLANSTLHPLAHVVHTIANVMRVPDSAQRVLAALPRVLVAAHPRLKGQKVRTIMESFLKEVDGLAYDAVDKVVMKRLAPLSRNILTFVVECAPTCDNSMAIAIEWIKSCLVNCVRLHLTEENKSPKCELPDSPQLDETRLRSFFEAAQFEAKWLVPVDKTGTEFNDPSWSLGKCAPQRAQLGAGTYASVWRARDRCTLKLFAVKTMAVHSRATVAVTAREVEVAKRLVSFAHPCVVKHFDFIHSKDPHACSMIMEYCDGGDLKAVVRKYRRRIPYVPPDHAYAWIAQVLLGLEFLHLTVGMLIRDVKPANVVLTAKSGYAKITDFGMSKLNTTSSGTYTLHPNMPPGSPHYVAPEILKGADYDYRADLYSLAVLVWVLLTGGIISSPKDPHPPCASQFTKLEKNWEKLRDCVNEPKKNDSEALPSAEARDFILRCTDRSPGYTPVTHKDVREHSMFRIVLPPIPEHGDHGALKDWLPESLRAGERSFINSIEGSCPSSFSS
jgi:hypothetical protein